MAVAIVMMLIIIIIGDSTSTSSAATVGAITDNINTTNDSAQSAPANTGRLGHVELCTGQGGLLGWIAQRPWRRITRLYAQECGPIRKIAATRKIFLRIDLESCA